MKQRALELKEQGNRLFTKREPMLTLWQEIADNFYPERADFTTKRSMGEEFAAHLMTGFPVIARRDLANTFSAMLRPRGQDWFAIQTEDEAINDDSTAKAWLEQATAIQRRAMYDRHASFIRATKEADHDFAAFGQAVMTCELDLATNTLLYRTWHLRDVAWCENERGQVDTVHHNWKPTVRYLIQKFGNKVDSKLHELVKKEPYREIECRRIIIPSDEYDYGSKKGRKLPFISLYIDCEHDTVLEEVPVRRSPFVIPRWQTVSGSQYAHSPATVVALPDARLLQRITLTLLEAGEKAVDPPMLAAREVLRSDINVFAGGVTYVDSEYDERLGEALRPLSTAGSGLAFGAEMADRYENMIKQAFYLNQITLPPAGEAMTAYEVRQRVEEYIRAALPLFEPMETEYNAALCELTFETLMDNGGFGSFDDMPPALGGQEIRFSFVSPLQAAGERKKLQAFQEASQLLAVAAQIDPQSTAELDVRMAFRDALGGASVPADWIVPLEQSQETRAAAAQAQQVAQTMQMVGGGAAVAEQVGKAGTALQGIA